MRGQVRELSAALVLLAATTAACKKDTSKLPDDRAEGAVTKGGPGGPVAPMPADAVRTSGTHYHVDSAPAAACAPGAVCTVLAEVTALDGYKVNDEYPFRFLPAPMPGITLDGDPQFHIHAKTSGRMTVRFTRDAAAAVPTPFAGNLKLSVCNPDECIVETAAVRVNIP